MPISSDLHALKRADLQKLCKKLGIKGANQKSEILIDLISKNYSLEGEDVVSAGSETFRFVEYSNEPLGSSSRMVAGQGRLNEKDGMTERERAVLSIVQLACPVPEETSTWIRKREISERIDDQAGDLIEKIKTPRLEESIEHCTPLASLFNDVMPDITLLPTAARPVPILPERRDTSFNPSTSSSLSSPKASLACGEKVDPLNSVLSQLEALQSAVQLLPSRPNYTDLQRSLDSLREEVGGLRRELELKREEGWVKKEEIECLLRGLISEFFERETLQSRPSILPGSFTLPNSLSSATHVLTKHPRESTERPTLDKSGPSPSAASFKPPIGGNHLGVGYPSIATGDDPDAPGNKRCRVVSLAVSDLDAGVVEGLLEEGPDEDGFFRLGAEALLRHENQRDYPGGVASVFSPKQSRAPSPATRPSGLPKPCEPLPSSLESLPSLSLPLFTPCPEPCRICPQLSVDVLSPLLTSNGRSKAMDGDMSFPFDVSPVGPTGAFRRRMATQGFEASPPTPPGPRTLFGTEREVEGRFFDDAS